MGEVESYGFSESGSRHRTITDFPRMGSCHSLFSLAITWFSGECLAKSTSLPGAKGEDRKTREDSAISASYPVLAGGRCRDPQGVCTGPAWRSYMLQVDYAFVGAGAVDDGGWDACVAPGVSHLRRSYLESFSRTAVGRVPIPGRFSLRNA